MENNCESLKTLAVLKARIGTPDRCDLSGNFLFPLGHTGLDARLGGGISRGRLHEFFAVSPHDQTSVLGFALMLAVRLGNGPILWLRQDKEVRRAGSLYPPGVADLGCDPSRIIEVLAPNEKALLQAAGDAVRCQEIAAILIEPWSAAQSFDLTASRRLSIAAETTGVTIFLLRGATDPLPSSAHTRWRVRAMPSEALAADAPGHPVIEVELTRHRGGIAPFRQRLEWDRDRSAFREPPLPGALVPFPRRRSVVPDPALERLAS